MFIKKYCDLQVHPVISRLMWIDRVRHLLCRPKVLYLMNVSRMKILINVESS